MHAHLGGGAGRVCADAEEHLVADEAAEKDTRSDTGTQTAVPRSLYKQRRSTHLSTDNSG